MSEAGAVVDPTTLATWSARAAAIGALPCDAASGTERLVRLWAGGRAPFDAQALQRLSSYLHFVKVGSGQRLLVHDEPGRFLLIILEGHVSVDRAATSRPHRRAAEAGPGDVVGEMALLDAGPRVSDCTTVSDCVIAVLEADALARLMTEDAQLALSLLAALARRLSLRLRQVSARLSALLADN